MNPSVVVTFLLVVVVAVSYASASECTTGDVKQESCNSCRCLQGTWACTRIHCLSQRDIPARFEAASRVRRDMHVAEDLKDTPCAPNDYFKVDCNVCYCNLEHTGYLCTNNYCDFSDFTTEKTPLESSPSGSVSWSGNVMDTSGKKNINNPGKKMGVNGEEEPSNADGCTPGTTYKKACNSCRCTETGLEICTFKACL